MADSKTFCGLCGKVVMVGNKSVGDIVDHFVYEFDGSLDYIELFHRKCAVEAGYKVSGNRVVGGSLRPGYKFGDNVDESQQVATYPQVNEALPELDEARGPRKPWRYNPFAENPVQVERIKYRFDTKRWESGNDWGFAVVDTQTGHSFVKKFSVKDFEGDHYACEKAARRETERRNRDWIEDKERQDGKRYQMVEQRLPQSAHGTIKRFGSIVLEVAPASQEDWVKKNKARFKSEYGEKKGTEVLYATAWKRAKKD